MKRSINSGGKRYSVPANNDKGFLCVICPAGDEYWVDQAPDLWEMNRSGFEAVKSSVHAVVKRGRLPDHEAVLFIKKFLVRSLGDRLKNLVRRSRACRAWRGGELVSYAGFNVPRVCCIIQPARLLKRDASILITEDAEAVSVTSWLVDKGMGLIEDKSARYEFLRAFAFEVARFHNAGLYHGDMRLGNILCRKDGQSYHFVWLDNERNRQFTKVPSKKREQNLMQINMEKDGISLQDRLCFWRTYAKTVNLSSTEKKKAVRKVRNWTQQRWRERGWIS